MTNDSPALWAQAGAYSADQVRALASGLLSPGSQQSVWAGTLVPSISGLTVTVGKGKGWLYAGQSDAPYLFVNRSATQVAISSADPALPRIDLVCLSVRDAAWSGSITDARVIVITGTPAAVPQAPALVFATHGFTLSIATVSVAAGATSGQLTDVRYNSNTSTVAIGGLVPTYSNNRPGSPFRGMQAWEQDTKSIIVWDGAQWVRQTSGANVPQGGCYARVPFDSYTPAAAAGTIPLLSASAEVSPVAGSITVDAIGVTAQIAGRYAINFKVRYQGSATVAPTLFLYVGANQAQVSYLTPSAGAASWAESNQRTLQVGDRVSVQAMNVGPNIIGQNAVFSRLEVDYLGPA